MGKGFPVFTDEGAGAVHPRFPVASIQNPFRCPLEEDGHVSLVVVVEGRHVLAAGIEGQRVHPRPLFAQPVQLQTGLHGQYQESRFHGIAGDAQPIAVGSHFGIVAQGPRQE